MQMRIARVQRGWCSTAPPTPCPALPLPRPEVAAAGKRALGMRYKLISYIYTAFHSAAASGVPVMRPLWFNFPADRNTHRNDRRALPDGLLGGSSQGCEPQPYSSYFACAGCCLPLGMRFAGQPELLPSTLLPPLLPPPSTCRQFMIGDALLVSPVLEQGTDSVEAYLPPGTWHSLWEDGAVVDAG